MIAAATIILWPAYGHTSRKVMVFSRSGAPVVRRRRGGNTVGRRRRRRSCFRRRAPRLSSTRHTHRPTTDRPADRRHRRLLRRSVYYIASSSWLFPRARLALAARRSAHLRRRPLSPLAQLSCGAISVHSWRARCYIVCASFSLFSHFPLSFSRL